jgi:hypothetical protein
MYSREINGLLNEVVYGFEFLLGCDNKRTGWLRHGSCDANDRPTVLFSRLVSQTDLQL